MCVIVGYHDVRRGLRLHGGCMDTDDIFSYSIFRDKKTLNETKQVNFTAVQKLRI